MVLDGCGGGVMMKLNKNYRVKITNDDGNNSLSITHNGYQWTSILINGKSEAAQICKELIAFYGTDILEEGEI
jgi:hypothetical protein